MEVQSITINVPISQVKELVDIASKHNWDIISKTDFNPISIAENAPGAEIIDELEGVFASCHVAEDWKEIKYQELKDKHHK